MPTKRKAKRATTTTKRPRRWSKRVTQHSDAMDLEPAVFTKGAKSIAASVKKSAEKSGRRKSTPLQSAMSMLTFYVNRAGTKLSAARKRTVDRAKDELRKLFHRGEPARGPAAARG